MLLKKIAEGNAMVLTDPATPAAPITGYNDRGIDVSLRVWVKGEDYWTVYFDLNNAIKAGFEQYDVKFALPKVEVHND